jgi:streptogramin lyase
VTRRAAVFAIAALLAACSDDGEEPTTPSVDPGPLVVALEGRPSAIAAGDGVLWVADDERGVVLRLDATDGRPVGDPIPVSPTPRALAVGTGAVWVADSDGTVTRIDSESGTAGPPFALGGALVDVIADGAGAWVGDIEAGTVRAIGPDGGVGAAIEVPAGVVRLALAGRQLWVTGLESSVTPIDVVTSVVGAPVAVGTGPIGMAVADDVLWVTNSDDRTVSRLDARDGRPRGDAVEVGPAPIAVVVDGASVWVLNQDGPSLSRLDDDDRIDLPMRPRGMALTDAGIWVIGVDRSCAVLIPRT